MNWVVVGQGAIGLLAACRMQDAGLTVTLHTRTPLLNPVTFTSLDNRIRHYPFNAATPPYKAVLLPVKSYDVVSAVRQLLPLLASDAQLVLSHNGMGTIEQVLPLLGRQQGLWFLTTTQAAFRNRPLQVHHTGNGQSILAPLNTAARLSERPVIDAMDAALGPVIAVSDVLPYLWQKLAINAVINPLTAIHNCRNGTLAESRFQIVIEEILQEVCSVSAAMGYPLDAASSLNSVMQVIQATANNYSSMQQDVQRQRTTEINAINGYIVNCALQYGLPAPVNLQLQQQVLQLQQTYGR